jgi:acyl transferase domain-containing protein/phosphopantetheinyl transferase
MTDVAIVGMACLFPGAPDLETFARNLAGGVDAIGDLPAGRWDPEFYDPTSKADDRFYTRRGGFVDDLAIVDPVALGVPPRTATAVEPDQLIALHVALRALADAGLDRRDFDRRRAGVILGRGNYAGAGRTRLEQHVRGAAQLVRALRGLLPGLDEETLARVKREAQAASGWVGADAAIGLVPNLTASRIANRLDLGGAAYTVDAACASARVAVDHAVAELRSGKLDVVLAGGVHFCHDEAFWSVFCQLGAVSRRGEIRPFDRAADGVLLGEGCGIVVLRRRADAERDGDRVYAVIRGSAVSSDGRGSLMAPSVDGQVLAVERAWRDAGLDPATIGLVEAHGTATLAGDGAELETLRRVFGGAPAGQPRAILGSVKSMIGHAMPAAGAAGLIKAALALHRRELLPSLHCEAPRDELAATRFEVLAAAAPWGGREVRRAAVNAFGFGGINAHLILDEASPSPRLPRVAPARPEVALDEAVPEQVLRLAGTPEAIGARLDAIAAGAPLVDDLGVGPARLAVIDPTPVRLAAARKAVSRGAPWRGRDGVFYAPHGLLAGGGTVCFAYPGIDADFRPRLVDVADDFGWALAPELAPTTTTTSIEHVGAGLVAAGRMLTSVLAELGITPALACGHSVGEWSAMAATGMLRGEDVDALADSARTGLLEVPGVVFAAVGCGVARARAALDGLPDVAISHDNCPHQVILCGAELSVETAVQRLRQGGVLGQVLPFRSGFHSPLFAPFLEPHRDNFSRLAIAPATVPVWSATTCAPFPDEPGAVRELAARHLVEPVRFRELVERLHAGGARVFIQVGPGSLVPFVEDTLRGQPHLAIAANAPERGGVAQLWRLCAALWCEGAEPRFERLRPTRRPTAEIPVVRATTIKLPLAVPLYQPTTPLPLVAGPRPGDRAPGVAGAAAALLDEIGAASAAVREALARPRPAAVAPPREVRVVRTLDVATHPWLRDHAFMRQPPGWPVISDLHPVVPMTTTIAMMMAEVAALAPGRVVVAVEQLRALRWLAVPAPTEVAFAITFDPDRARARVIVEGFAEATVVLGAAHPPAPAHAPWPLVGEQPARIDAASLYRDRWMFHGAAFQGVAALGPCGDGGLRGAITTGAAPGALLDNAGQIFGYWVMERATSDRLAMPVGVERLAFFGPHPAPGVVVTCDVAIRVFEARRVVADLVLAVDGTPWCVITGWEDRRFDTDARLWDVLIWPERSQLARPAVAGVGDGPVLFEDTYRAAPTREQLMRRYLGERERAAYEAQPPRGQRAHLAGRIAAKDAVRLLLQRAGSGPRFPVEIELVAEASGRPTVRAPGGRDVRVSIAHKDDRAVAIAAFDHDVGVDLERIEDRPASFAAVAFHPEELALIGPGDDVAEWQTRLWAAKEALGKLRGTGLPAGPAAVRISDRAGESLVGEGRRIETRRLGDHILAWTPPPP